MIKGCGLDLGTNMIVYAAMDEEDKPIYKKQRDAFYRLTPKSEINAKSIKRALEEKKANFILDGSDFIIVGEDALLMANDRNDNARRPMSKGVLSPKEKDSLPMVKLLIKSVVGEGNKETPIVFSVPAAPVDSDFDIFFHTEIIKSYLFEIGFINPTPINEAFAVAFSELIDDGLNGLCLSFGAGMVNVVVCYEGDAVAQFSITRGGDWIDSQAGKAVDEKASLIQIEKEGGIDLINPGTNKMHEAIAVYYKILIKHSIDVILYELKKAELPFYRNSLPIIVSGGLTLANGFVDLFKQEIKGREFPFGVKEVRRAEDPMTCVARGALLASTL